MRLLATIATITALLAAPVFAQSGNPAFMTPETGPEQPNNADRVFVHAAAIGGMAEVELGELAEQKAQSQAVKEFGRRMVEDHGKANERLISIAKEAGIPVPHELDEIGSGQQVDLRTFAAESLPIVLAHLRSAQELQAEMIGKAY